MDFNFQSLGGGWDKGMVRVEEKMRNGLKDRVLIAIGAVVAGASLFGAGPQLNLNDAEVLLRNAEAHLSAECTPEVFAGHYAKIHAKDPGRAKHLAALYFWLVEDDAVRATIFSVGGWMGGILPLYSSSSASVTNLMFTATEVVETGTGQVLRAAVGWPQSQEMPEDKLVVIFTPSLTSAYWDWFDEFEVVPSAESATIDLPMDNGMGFFKVATLADTTSSGVPDIYERIAATNPMYGDLDGDGLSDWYEEWIGTDPENPYSIAESDPNNPDYYDEFGNPLPDGEIVGKWHEPNEEREDDTPPDWDGLLGLDLTLCDMDLYDDAWILRINVPFRDVPDKSAAQDYFGSPLTNVGNVTQVARRTIYVEAGQNVSFWLQRVSAGTIPELFAWNPVTKLQPGLVISTGGHMGITDYDGEGINAGSKIVHKAFNFFGSSGSTYRRYEP